MLMLVLVACSLMLTTFPDAFHQVQEGYQDELGFHFVRQQVKVSL